MTAGTELGQGGLTARARGQLLLKQVFFSVPPDAKKRESVSGLQLELRAHCDQHSQAVLGEPVSRSLISVALGP